MQVTSSTSTTAYNSTDSLAGKQSTLSQKDFLQLLVAQMQNQNPLSPQSNTEMAAQMAQFSSLQQSTDMSSSLNMLQANSLIGTTVNLQVDSKTVVNGVVQGVVLQDSKMKILVNGSAYDLKQVISVAPTITPAAGETSAAQ